MTRMSFVLAGPLTVLLCLPLSLTGCGSSDAGADATATSETSPASSAANEVSETNTPRLTGVWLGVGYLDEEKLAAALESLTDENERTQVQAVADSFLSTRIGVNFAEDQTYQLEMAITGVDGQTRRGETTGTWKVISQEEKVWVVEQHDASTDDVKTSTYSFVDADHFAMTPPVAEVLQSCEPLIVFERQGSLAELEAAAAAEMAEAEDATQTR